MNLDSEGDEAAGMEGMAGGIELQLLRLKLSSTLVEEEAGGLELARLVGG